MPVLWDKGFDSNAFLAQVTSTGAQVLGRLRKNRRTPILARLSDGSYLSMIGTVKVRIIDAEITVTCADGTWFSGSYRLVTTLTDARRHPAAVLIGLYHERWEHESAYFALRHTLLRGRPMRSGDPAGLKQEMWALLTLYQALRTVMVAPSPSRPPAIRSSRPVASPPTTPAGSRRCRPAFRMSRSDAVAWASFDVSFEGRRTLVSRSCPLISPGWRTSETWQ